MIINLFNHSYLVFAFLMLSACNEFKTDEANRTILQKPLQHAIANGVFKNLNSDIFTGYFNDTIYLLQKKTSKINYKLKLEQISNGINNNFYISPEDYNLLPTEKQNFNNFSIKFFSVVNYDFKTIKINIEALKNYTFFPFEEITKQNSPSTEVLLEEDFINKQFNNDLKTGAYFEIPNNTYLLISKQAIYVMSQNRNNFNEEKFMLHFIKKGNEFFNKDFYLNQNDISSKLIFDKNLNVAKINFPFDKFNITEIRIGQFNNDEKIWSKQFNLNLVRSNSLLKYQ